MTFRVRVFDSRIAALHEPGGDIWNWSVGVKDEIVAGAKVICPKRTGQLAESIHGSVGANTLGTFINVSAEASYAGFVHEGTFTPILPRFATYMKFRGYGPWTGGNATPPDGYWRLRSVQGQRAQPFLRDAMDAVFASHGII